MPSIKKIGIAKVGLNMELTTYPKQKGLNPIGFSPFNNLLSII
jgi:hypothetical protein